MNRTIALRMTALTSVALSLTLVAAPVARAHHRPKTYCSETGDLCQSADKVEGVRKLRLELSAPYFRRYVLCVSSPLGYDTCRTFRVRTLDDGLYGGSIRARRYFSVMRRGSYTVSWYRVPDQGPATELIGRRLGFHVRG